ncbi:hypothetical protein [Chryseobacterium sp. RLHN22]|uniref:hypothetical protein n=1 Tax=Chryseobacterium sp. RLHN22 TaxID=3437885 RepID=UPI003D9B6701
MISILKKLLNVSDQMLMTLWSFVLTILLSHFFEKEDFFLYNIYFIIQSIAILLINSSIGQLFLLDGKKYTPKSIIKWILLFSLLTFGIVFGAIQLDMIKMVTSLWNIFLITYCITMFCCFELTRRYFYSENLFKNSLVYTLILVVSNLLICIILYFLNRLNITSLLFFIGIVYSLVNIIVLLSFRKISNKDKVSLKINEIVEFNKWLLPGAVAYIITSQLFIIYMNNIDNKSDVINLRLLETVFGVVLVFVAAFENYFIATIKDLNLKSIIKKLSRIWLLFIIVMTGLSFFVNDIFSLLFNNNSNFSIYLILLVLTFYILSVISRILVVYLRLNKFNNIIFFANTINSLFVIFIIVKKIDLDLQLLFILKIIFIVISMILYIIPNLFRWQKK